MNYACKVKNRVNVALSTTSPPHTQCTKKSFLPNNFDGCSYRKVFYRNFSLKSAQKRFLLESFSIYILL